MPIPIAFIARHANATRQDVVLSLRQRGLTLRRAADVVEEVVAFEVARELAIARDAAVPEMLAAAVEMEAAHRRLRRSDFNVDLLRTVRENGERWAALPALEQQLKARHVEAEVLDYFGEYAEAAAKVTASGEAQVQPLREVIQNGWPGDEAARTVIKRRLWVALAYATVFYRRGDYDRALEIVDVCDGSAAAGDAPALLGTRARLAHSRGQVYRQLQRYSDALSQFELATTLARERFAVKTPDAEQTTISAQSFDFVATPAFDDHRLLAHATVGKCLALGTGWLEFSNGRLSSADLLMNAGYVLLRSTGDVVHRAYALLLIGAVRRARVGNDLNGLKAAIAIMEDGARVLSEHPQFTLHASYELLLAYCKHPAYKEKAQSHLRTLKGALGSGDTWRSKREARWSSLVSIVESRLRRLQADPDLKRSLAAADAALRAARFAGSSAVIAEAEIAIGEVRLAQGEPRLAEVRFEWAIKHATPNPKILAAAHLHRARSLCRLGGMYRAHVARAEADTYIGQVEHGFIRDLASIVDAELRTAGFFFKDLRQLVRDAVREDRAVDRQNLLEAVEWHLFQHAKAEAQEPHTLLGLSERQFRRRYSQLRQKIGQPPSSTDS